MKPPLPEKPSLPPTSDSLPIVLLRARETVMAPIRAMLADTGVTEQQWRVLRVLAEQGPLEVSKVAERASLLFPSLTRTATLMRERDLISQEQDHRDRRRHLLRITAKGQAIIDQNLEQALAISAAYKERLGPENYDDLLRLLNLLSDPD